MVGLVSMMIDEHSVQFLFKDILLYKCDALIFLKNIVRELNVFNRMKQLAFFWLPLFSFEQDTSSKARKPSQNC